jgi:hypothetical protein
MMSQEVVRLSKVQPNRASNDLSEGASATGSWPSKVTMCNRLLCVNEDDIAWVNGSCDFFGICYMYISWIDHFRFRLHCGEGTWDVRRVLLVIWSVLLYLGCKKEFFVYSVCQNSVEWWTNFHSMNGQHSLMIPF